MKKVMFYSNHTRIGNAAEAVKNNGTLILFYTVFVCALLIGSSLYISTQENEVFEKLAEQFLLNKIEHTAILLICCAAITSVIGVFAGLSCSGVLVLVFLPFFQGLALSIILTYLLTHYGAKGLGYFSLLILPGAMMYITTSLVMCRINTEISRKICGILFFEQKETLRFRAFAIKQIIILCVMLFSVFVTYLLNILFAGLFD